MGLEIYLTASAPRVALVMSVSYEPLEKLSLMYHSFSRVCYGARQEYLSVLVTRVPIWPYSG